jgi:hypothetical protein
MGALPSLYCTLVTRELISRIGQGITAQRGNSILDRGQIISMTKPGERP